MKRLSVYVICGAICALFLGNANMAAASELVYRPINPSFGGHPLNGQFLLDLAQVQNKFRLERDPIEDFERRLTSGIIYRLARDIIAEAFGEDVLQVGHYEIGSYTIDITTDGVFITTVMTDTLTGDTTTITIPYYEF